MKETYIDLVEKKIKKSIHSNFGINLKKIVVDKIKDIQKGDIYTNAAMITVQMYKKEFGKSINLDEVFNAIKKDLESMNFFSKFTLLNGFINMEFNNDVKSKILKNASLLQKDYGQFHPKNLFYNIEYVSANPTGSLHIGHARNAALGMTLNNIWTKYGIKVDTEYYVNDGGSQINKLGMSVFVRYLQELGVSAKMRPDWYKGQEPIIVAKKIAEEYKTKYKKYKYNSDEIENKKVFEFFKDYSKTEMLNLIKKDLKDFRVKFKRYYHESDIYNKQLIPKTIQKLGKNVFVNEGATWLKTTKYGDDKDRVIVKSNKDFTYFMPDIAYHNIKLSRGYDKIFNVFGADHNAYVTSMKAAIGCLGHKVDKIHFIIMQMVKLTKNGEEFKMSKRSGQSLTLRNLIDSIGVDAARWALVTQASDSHLEIDINQFNKNDNDTNLNYVYYTLSRINKIFKKAKKQKISFESKILTLNSDLEREIINMVMYYPHTIQNIAKFYEIQKLPSFILSLSRTINSYYEQTKILDSSNINLTKEKLLLLNAAKATIISGLALMNIK